MDLKIYIFVHVLEGQLDLNCKNLTFLLFYYKLDERNALVCYRNICASTESDNIVHTNIYAS